MNNKELKWTWFVILANQMSLLVMSLIDVNSMAPVRCCCKVECAEFSTIVGDSFHAPRSSDECYGTPLINIDSGDGLVPSEFPDTTRRFAGHGVKSWWRHQIEKIIRVTALCVGNSPVTGESPHKRQWRGALMFSLICAWTNGCANNRDNGDLRRHCIHYDVTIIKWNLC